MVNTNSASSNLKKVRTVLIEAEKELRIHSKTSRLDAELLLANLLEIRRIDLVIQSDRLIEESLYSCYRQLICRRAKHEPIAYITGRREFWGLEFKVNRSVLIPRPETEILIEEGLRHIDDQQQPITEPLHIIDLGTGYGCLIIAMVSELIKRSVSFKAWAVDRSSSALSTARKNAEQLGVANRITFVKNDWLTATGEPLFDQAQFDLILTNPPYVSREEPLVCPDILFEPPEALFSDQNGIRDVSQLLNTAPKRLKLNGSLVCEIGAGQSHLVHNLLTDILTEGSSGLNEPKPWSWRFASDLAGKKRSLILKRLY